MAGWLVVTHVIIMHYDHLKICLISNISKSVIFSKYTFLFLSFRTFSHLLHIFTLTVGPNKSRFFINIDDIVAVAIISIGIRDIFVNKTSEMQYKNVKYQCIVFCK